MKNEMLETMRLPTVSGFLEFLGRYAKPNAPYGEGDFDLTDGCGLLETFLGLRLEGGAAARLKTLYDEWCYGHVGDKIEEVIQIPGAAVFKTDNAGQFTDAAYLYRKYGPDLLDWEIFTAAPGEGLLVAKLDGGYTHWGLPSMVLRFNVHGPMTKDLPHPQAGRSYGVVWSSVLNFRAKGDRHLVTSVPNGTVLPLTGEVDGDWTGCEVNGISGYVFTRFLVKHNQGVNEGGNAW